MVIDKVGVVPAEENTTVGTGRVDDAAGRIILLLQISSVVFP